MLNLFIIIPVYNGSTSIFASVQSLIDDTLPNDIQLKVFIVDDGSTDNSLEVVKKLSEKYPTISYFTQKNSGVSIARNRAMKEVYEYSKSMDEDSWIGFLDADDIWTKGWSYKIAAQLSDQNDDILGFGIQCADNNGNIQTVLPEEKIVEGGTKRL